MKAKIVPQISFSPNIVRFWHLREVHIQLWYEPKKDESLLPSNDQAKMLSRCNKNIFQPTISQIHIFYMWASKAG